MTPQTVTARQSCVMESTSLAILVIDANRIRASIVEAGLR